MAEIINTTLVCDFDGTSPAERVQFEHGSHTYTLDLSALPKANFEKMRTAHAEKVARLEAEFEEKMAKYLDKATPVSNRKAKVKAGDDAAQIRKWAQENGLPVSEKGRIAGSVIDQYRDALNKADAPAEAETVSA